MSENKNHIFTFDNRIISYSVYEQALKDIEALREESKSLQEQIEVMREALSTIYNIMEKVTFYRNDVLINSHEYIEEALAKVSEIRGRG
jgi:hypothetical protein